VGRAEVVEVADAGIRVEAVGDREHDRVLPRPGGGPGLASGAIEGRDPAAADVADRLEHGDPAVVVAVIPALADAWRTSSSWLPT
jgi:hypothetical protein